MTTKQKRINTRITNDTFYFPCCGVAIVSSNTPKVENEDNKEDQKAQFMCQYGCGYQFI